MKLRNLLTSAALLAGLAFSTTPTQAALISSNFSGQVDDIIGDTFGGVFDGLAIGDEVFGATIYDDSLITGADFEFVAYDSLTFDFASIELSFAATDPFNALEFSFEEFIGFSLVDFDPSFDYFATGATMDIFDYDSFAEITASFTLPPNVFDPTENPIPGDDPVAVSTPGSFTLIILGGILLAIMMSGRRKQRLPITG